MYNGNFDKLEEFINKRTNELNSICKNKMNNKKCKKNKTLTPILSKQHIFIKIIQNYKGDNKYITFLQYIVTY